MDDNYTLPPTPTFSADEKAAITAATPDSAVMGNVYVSESGSAPSAEQSTVSASDLVMTAAGAQTVGEAGEPSASQGTPSNLSESSNSAPADTVTSSILSQSAGETLPDSSVSDQANLQAQAAAQNSGGAEGNEPVSTPTVIAAGTETPIEEIERGLETIGNGLAREAHEILDKVEDATGISDRSSLRSI